MSIKDKFRKINPKYLTAASSVVPVLLIAAFVYFVYLPDSGKVSTLRADLSQMESEIAKSRVMERKLEELKAANAKLQEQLVEATRYLPGAAEDAQFKDAVAGIAKESGMAVQSWTPGQVVKEPSGLYEQTTITVELQGGFHELGQFMQRLDAMERMLTVTALQMSDAKLQGTKMSIPVKLTIVAFSAAGGK